MQTTEINSKCISYAIRNQTDEVIQRTTCQMRMMDDVFELSGNVFLYNEDNPSTFIYNDYPIGRKSIQNRISYLNFLNDNRRVKCKM